LRRRIERRRNIRPWVPRNSMLIARGPPAGCVSCAVSSGKYSAVLYLGNQED
jgi:hypothetical protein